MLLFVAILVPQGHPGEQQGAPLSQPHLLSVLFSPPAPRYLGQAGSEENTFKQFPHPSQELIHIRPLEHIHLRKSRAV